MALFEKISKSVTEASQKTIAKTKELADTSRLNSTITDEEKMIATQYALIGELYAKIHKEDFENDFAEMMSVIAASEVKIENCRAQIQAFKNVRCCEHCGAEVAIVAAFCGACGASMPKYEPPKKEGYMICEQCGAEVKEGLRFCVSCGNQIVIEEAVAEEVPVERFCPDCGAKDEEGLDFCTECGTKL